ncbi:MAG: aminodeoxychorismate lyase [Gammaproteobacteria bacterium]|nr:aminodeoxychorismate lyase [Gammaproteobacteria bacterium]
MTSLVNGVATQHISITDRGLLYGQSLFETIAVADGEPLLLGPHLERLERGARVLSIALDESALLEEIASLAAPIEHGVLRVTLTMGGGGRGYANPSTPHPLRIVSSHAYPDFDANVYETGIVLGLSDVTLADQPLLAGHKHGNRLEQIMARSRWQDEWQEALLCGADGGVIEATQSNVFIRNGGQLNTPDLSSAGVAGVMREFVLNTVDELGLLAEVVPLSVADIEAADEVFLTNSLIGAWPVRKFQAAEFNDFTSSQQLLDIMQRDGAIQII